MNVKAVPIRIAITKLLFGVSPVVAKRKTFASQVCASKNAVVMAAENRASGIDTDWVFISHEK